MNAGSSDVGQAFALRNCDAFFVATAGARASLTCNASKVAEVKTAGQNLDRQIEVFTVGQVICRPTPKEAEDYYRHVNIENADWGAIDGMLANKNVTPQTIPFQEYEKKRRYQHHMPLAA
jgi:alkanesulfonate monooxygenase SsuD/methylene tetrahydromethanopterin reductase-like flavin-dependent oxidoreductase (luciferase family)